MWAFYEHPQLNHQIINGFYKNPTPERKINFIAVPTTIGTGSETSAILYNVKFPIVTNDFLPDVVVLDPKLVLGIPKNIIISTMIDACSHSIEVLFQK